MIFGYSKTLHDTKNVAPPVCGRSPDEGHDHVFEEDKDDLLVRRPDPVKRDTEISDAYLAFVDGLA
ncbi:hypothetical protein MUK42_01098 [Musa troglodytarum]|uniref:Uncharacterized protein n=1 Tax=Musa troglodytarum TaxID=320322 RepID=A0A9E7K532_9LILI|nr:hypothetical protein MUK42_01098 [Musa troglodytarum]